MAYEMAYEIIHLLRKSRFMYYMRVICTCMFIDIHFNCIGFCGHIFITYLDLTLLLVLWNDCFQIHITAYFTFPLQYIIIVKSYECDMCINAFITVTS